MARALDLHNERGACAHLGLDFHSFPIDDYGVPASMSETEAFARRLVDLLAAGRGVALHCRVGIGRSSLIAACTMVVAGIDVRAAFKSIGVARGLAVPDTDEQRDWALRFAARLQL